MKTDTEPRTIIIRFRALIRVALLAAAVAGASPAVADGAAGNRVSFISVSRSEVYLYLYPDNIVSTTPAASTACRSNNQIQVKVLSSHPFYREILAVALASYVHAKPYVVDFNAASCEVNVLQLQHQ